MKEFDLQAAKNGANVKTRNGRPARIICFDRLDPARPIVALVQNVPNDNGSLTYGEEIFFYAPNGKTNTDNDGLDLVMATQNLTPKTALLDLCAFININRLFGAK